MSKKKKREERNNGIKHAVHEIVKKMMPTLHAIEEKNENWPEPEKKKKENKTPRYEELVIKVVDSVENKRKLDRAAFNELIGMHPHLEPIVREMISQAKLYSVYDLEPLVVNFDYSRWLKKIKIKLEA